MFSFYRLIERRDFEAAHRLLSDYMRERFLRPEDLEARFADTADIAVTRYRVTSQSELAATVSLDFVETFESGSSQRLQGTWDLIRIHGRWLLDVPQF